MIENAERIFEKVFKLTGGRETEVIVFSSEEALTRFADNTVSQNVANRSSEITIRVLDEGRMGRVSLNHAGDGALARAVETALSQIGMQKKDPDLLPLADPVPLAANDACWDDETAAFPPAGRADKLSELVAACAPGKMTATGSLTSGWSRIAIGTSKGVRAAHRESEASFKVTIKDGDGLGWADAYRPRIGEIDFPAVGARAIEKARLAKAPVELKPGRFTVVLEPDPVANLLLYTSIYGFGGMFYNEGQSFCSGKLGTKLLGGNISIEDNGLEGPAAGMPFDFEGQPRRRVSLVEKGVVKAVVHDRKSAKAAGTVSTGHSLPQPNTYGPLPGSIAVAPGESSLADMIKSTERGVLVTQFHYTNLLKPHDLELTGMTRNGTYLIEDGRIVRPVKNMRFTESVVGVLNRVEAVGRERTPARGFFGGKFLVPALKVRDFNFSSSTEF